MRYLSETEYNRGIAYIENHFDENRPLGSPEGDYFEMVMDAVMEYEALYYPITLVDQV